MEMLYWNELLIDVIMYRFDTKIKRVIERYGNLFVFLCCTYLYYKYNLASLTKSKQFPKKSKEKNVNGSNSNVYVKYVMWGTVSNAKHAVFDYALFHNN